MQDVGGQVEDMRDALTKAREAGSRAAGPSSASGAAAGDLPDPNSFSIPDGEDDDDYVAGYEQQQQEEMLREQDYHLDGVFQTVGNLRRQADDMGRELEEQREMLEVVDTVADRVGGRLQTGLTKLQFVIRRNEDRWSSYCIAILIMVLTILLVLVVVL